MVVEFATECTIEFAIPGVTSQLKSVTVPVPTEGNACKVPVPSIYCCAVPAPVNVRVPDPVTGDPETTNAGGADKPTLVTEPEPPEASIVTPLPVCVNVILVPAFKNNVLRTLFESSKFTA